ncbi:MAG: hypothetical protein CV088_02280 [Nitrospira sp. LK70]|nr:hypothetical protein [Nitrospira sp. LK70]
MEQVNSMAIQLGMTPHYLDARCHEALYEVDVGVNEVRGRLGKDVAREELVGVRGLQMDTTCISSQGSFTHR